MDGERARRLSVEDAKEKLRRRADPAGADPDVGPGSDLGAAPDLHAATEPGAADGPGTDVAEERPRSLRLVGAAIEEAKRRPLRTAGIAIAAGVILGTSRTARRTLIVGLRRAIARRG